MGLTKLGEIQHRSCFSRCQKCKWHISGYKCWNYNYIPYYRWQNYDDNKDSGCEHFKSTIPNQCNSHYVHKDYEDRDRFPEKKFGGKYRFDSKGKRI